MKRLRDIARDTAEGVYHLVKLIREGTSTKEWLRVVQCEGDRDETTTGREMWRGARNIGPGGFRHVAAEGEHGLLLDIPWGDSEGVVIGVDDDDDGGPGPGGDVGIGSAMPMDLEAGETAIYNSKDTQGRSMVRCHGSIVTIGVGAGGLIIRKDYFVNWWTDGPQRDYSLHGHTGVMAGPGTSGLPNNALSNVGVIEGDHGHKVR